MSHVSIFYARLSYNQCQIIEMSIVLGGTAIGAVVAGGVIAALWTTLGSAAPGILIGLIVSNVDLLCWMPVYLSPTDNCRCDTDRVACKACLYTKHSIQLSRTSHLRHSHHSLD